MKVLTNPTKCTDRCFLPSSPHDPARDTSAAKELRLIDYVTDTTINVLECQVIYYGSFFLSGKMVTNDHVNRCHIHLANNAHNWSAARSK